MNNRDTLKYLANTRLCDTLVYTNGLKGIMKKTLWDPLKSKRLKKTRGVSFKEIITGKVIKIEGNPSHPNQQMMLIEYKDYIWIVPFVETDKEFFLKTLYQSHKYTKIYKKGAQNETNEAN